MKFKNFQKDEEGDCGDCISPKRRHVKLRYGDPLTFNITFISPEHYPIDMYYLMDLSQSMSDDLEALKGFLCFLSFTFFGHFFDF